jgi:ribosomal protein S6--L-glutamate ligase
MHVTVLSRSPAIYTTRRLVEAARARGHRVRVLDPVQVEMGLGGAAPALFYRRERFPRTDVVIPRVAPSINQYGLAVVNQLQLRGLPVLNGTSGISASRNKMRCLQLLAGSGIGVPLTVMASDASRLKEMVKHVGGLPVLVKLLSSSDRTGVMICETLQSLEAALEAILGLGQNIIVQGYVKGAAATCAPWSSAARSSPRCAGGRGRAASPARSRAVPRSRPAASPPAARASRSRRPASSASRSAPSTCSR